MMGLSNKILKILSQWLSSPTFTTPISEPIRKKITICELNTENLFISLEHYDGTGVEFENLSESQWRKLALPQLRNKQKPLRKIWGLATAILDINPDILMLIEVGGKESLDHFNEYFLNDSYISHFVETNSNRSIDLAFLVKKDLKMKAQTISNRQFPIKMGNSSALSTRFSRDVAELHLFEKNKLQLILLLTHLKSKISTEKDYQGRSLRRAEAESLIHLYHKICERYPDVPVVVGGDLNSELSSPELEILASSNLIDFHELIGAPPEHRISFVHFNYQGEPQPQTLDYLLVSPHLHARVDGDKSYTYRYKSYYDTPHPLPSTVHQRYHMPSDHFPLVLTIEL
jgi:endonuclease/exonuclease/phosphatase family metal-dependent hydrolase